MNKQNQTSLVRWILTLLRRTGKRILTSLALQPRLPLLTLIGCGLPGYVLAQSTTSQQLSLQPGWNAVWLEVEPRDAAGKPKPPSEIFANPSISVVASFFPESGPVQFIESPTETTLNTSGWAVWYRNDPAKRNSLQAVRANRAYLVRVEAAPVILTLTGEPSFHVYRWVPDSYNLFGFGIVAGNNPSFATFFGPAGDKHPVASIFKLEPGTGAWKAVIATEAMEPGTAYWIYSNGNSSYQGPLRVDIRGAGDLAYGSTLRDHELLLFNESSSGSLGATMTRVNPANQLELLPIQRDPARLTEVEANHIATLPFGALGPRQSVIETLRIRRAWTDTPEKRQLYRIASESTYFWLPVSGLRTELATPAEASPNIASKGLWVGDVVLQTISGRVPAAALTAGSEPVPVGPKVRVILHVNGSGEVSLVKAVTVMRKRSGSDTEPQQVLVVDPDKIPFYEGIDQRGGRLVGKRIETSYYDLPRTIPPPEPLPANFDRTTLREDYRLTLPLSGGVGPGRRCSTDAVGIVLDPWHRTNPFRHAFHPAHTAGYRITREFQWDFDPPTTESARGIENYGQDQLVGTLTETFRGLVRPSEKIQVTGRFVLRRISENAALE